MFYGTAVQMACASSGNSVYKWNNCVQSCCNSNSLVITAWCIDILFINTICPRKRNFLVVLGLPGSGISQAAMEYAVCLEHRSFVVLNCCILQPAEFSVGVEAPKETQSTSQPLAWSLQLQDSWWGVLLPAPHDKPSNWSQITLLYLRS